MLERVALVPEVLEAIQAPDRGDDLLHVRQLARVDGDLPPDDAVAGVGGAVDLHLADADRRPLSDAVGHRHLRRLHIEHERGLEPAPGVLVPQAGVFDVADLAVEVPQGEAIRLDPGGLVELAGLQGQLGQELLLGELELSGALLGQVARAQGVGSEREGLHFDGRDLEASPLVHDHVNIHPALVVTELQGVQVHDRVQEASVAVDVAHGDEVRPQLLLDQLRAVPVEQRGPGGDGLGQVLEPVLPEEGAGVRQVLVAVDDHLGDVDLGSLDDLEDHVPGGVRVVALARVLDDRAHLNEVVALALVALHQATLDPGDLVEVELALVLELRPLEQGLELHRVIADEARLQIGRQLDHLQAQVETSVRADLALHLGAHLEQGPEELDALLDLLRRVGVPGPQSEGRSQAVLGVTTGSLDGQGGDLPTFEGVGHHQGQVSLGVVGLLLRCGLVPALRDLGQRLGRRLGRAVLRPRGRAPGQTQAEGQSQVAREPDGEEGAGQGWRNAGGGSGVRGRWARPPRGCGSRSASCCRGTAGSRSRSDRFSACR